MKSRRRKKRWDEEETSETLPTAIPLDPERLPPRAKEALARLKASEARAKAERKLLDPIRKKLDYLQAVRDGLIPPRWMTAKRPSKGSKPGSAATWIDELWPNREWHLLTGKQVHQAIEREAKTRGLNKWPSPRAVYLELADRNRRQSP
jgi:hypothetical protein